MTYLNGASFVPRGQPVLKSEARERAFYAGTFMSFWFCIDCWSTVGRDHGPWEERLRRRQDRSLIHEIRSGHRP